MTINESTYTWQFDSFDVFLTYDTVTPVVESMHWRFRTDMNPSQEWKDYCQALRDIIAQAGFPWNIQWPEQPK